VTPHRTLHTIYNCAGIALVITAGAMLGVSVVTFPQPTFITLGLIALVLTVIK
jgi:FtsH-binding integral membrane protein